MSISNAASPRRKSAMRAIFVRRAACSPTACEVSTSFARSVGPDNPRLQIIDPRKILHQRIERLSAILGRDAEYGRRVDRDQYFRSPLAVEEFSAIDQHLDLRTEKSAHRGAAEADDQTRSDEPDF